MLETAQLIGIIKNKIACLGEAVCKLEKLGKPAILKERAIMRLIAYKVWLEEPNGGDESIIRSIKERAIKEINNV